MAYSIRRCEFAENAEWARLRHALWPHEALEEHSAEIEDGMLGNVLRGYLAFDLVGEAVGIAEISIRRYANGSTESPVPFVEGIWISDKHRRHGIGRLLIKKISDDCAAEGFVEMCSDADVTNLVSHRAHESWGFAETERVVYFRKAL